jgi:hypothetical protein
LSSSSSNGHECLVAPDEFVETTISMAEGKMAVEVLAIWFRKRLGGVRRSARTARERAYDLVLRRARLGGFSALGGRLPVTAFVFESRTNNRSAWLTDAESGKTAAISGSRNTTL